MSLKDLDSLLSLLTERKRKMEQEEVETNLQILLEFLVYLRKKKLEELSEMQNDLKYIKEDIQVIQKRRIDLSNIKDRYNLRVRMVDDDLTMMDPPASMPVTNDCGTQGTMTSGSMSVCRDDPLRSQEIRETNAIACSGSQHLVPSEKVTARKRQIQAQFTDLQEYYLKRRRNWAKTSQAAPERDLNVTNSLGYHVGLEDLQTVLTSCTRYSQLRVVSELRCGDFFHPANIFSSIEFDRDNELFAIAGASRRIKVFEFSSVMDEPAEVHCAVVDIATRSKLSCLSWNKYSKNYIAGSDYEGIVNVWDVNTRQSVGEYEEHEKRAWSVDFSWTEPSLLVSGGDDCKVKVWSTKQEGSVLTINMNANICSVKCNPGSSVHVAVGSADRQVYYYRFRASDSEDTDDDRGQHFVSAVCWKSGSPIILAANSRGNINVLSLTT